MVCIKLFVCVLQQMYAHFATSMKYWEILMSQYHINLLCETRWEAKLESIKAVQFEISET